MKTKRQIQNLIRHILLFIFGVAMLFPFLWMIATSMKTGSEVYTLSLFPKNPSLKNYVRLFESGNFPFWFLNSMYVGLVVTLSVLFFDSLVGYTLCKFNFKGKKLIFEIGRAHV